MNKKFNTNNNASIYLFSNQSSFLPCVNFESIIVY